MMVCSTGLAVTLFAVGFKVTDGLSVQPYKYKVAKASSTELQATWSDSRAVQEYQDFLSTGKQDLDRLKDGPAVVVKPQSGDCQLADAIVQMGMGDDVVLSPGEELPPTLGGATEYPIYITVPAFQLKEFLESLPATFKDRRDDFVFMSGGNTYGNIEDLLKDKGYCRDSMTQFLVSGMKFSPILEDVSVKLGASANGEEKMAGECSACGKWCGAIEERLQKSNINCKAVFYREWRRLMWERSAFDAVFNLIGAVRTEPTTLSDVALYYGEEVSDMLWGISGMLRGWKALTMTFGFEERVFAIGETSGDKPCELVNEMYPYLYSPYENVGMLMEYMCYAQDECGLLQGVDIPRRPGDSDRKPIIREGNLRADGVV